MNPFRPRAAAGTPVPPGSDGDPTGAPVGNPEEVPAAARPGRVPLPRDVLVLVAAAFAVALGYGLVAPVLPQFARSFDVGVTAASVVVSAFAFFRLVFAPGGGLLVDRLGERRVYITGLLIVACSTLATGFAQSYWQLLLFRGLGGLGSTMFTISAMALLTRLAPPTERGRVAGLYATAFLVGNISGPVLGGALGRFGMRLPFFVYAGMLLVATAVVVFLLRGGRRRVAGSDQDQALPPMPLAEAFADVRYRVALVSGAANGWASFGVRVAIVPQFAVATFGDGATVAGTALASFAIGTGSVVALAGRLSDRVGRRPLVITGLVVAGTATALLGQCHTVPLLVAASVVAGIGSGLLNPSQQATVADVIGSERGAGRVMATYQMAQDCGTILGPIAVGLLVDRAGYGTGFAVTGALMLATACVWLFWGDGSRRFPSADGGAVALSPR